MLQPLQHFLEKFSYDLLYIAAEMAPYLILGLIFAGILHAFMPKSILHKYMNGGALKSSLNASLLGIPLPLCSCGVVPTGIAMYKNGASKTGTVSFLISTPQTGVDSILATFSVMGWAFAIFRPIAAFITGVTGGLITSRFTSEQVEIDEIDTSNFSAPLSFKEKVKKAVNYAFVDFVSDISKWLVIGIFLASLISALLPDDFIAVLQFSPLVQMSLVLLFSIPLYICATGSIPLAMVLLAKGLSPGAAFVLLMAGPATNIATVVLIANQMGKRTAASYLISIVFGALLFGLVIDYMLPSQLFNSGIVESLAHQHHAEFVWWKYLSLVLLSVLIIRPHLIRIVNKIRRNASDEKYITYSIEGMSCVNCKRKVETVLAKQKNIKFYEVDLSTKKIKLSYTDDTSPKFFPVLTKLGYKLTQE